jgi:hypothetical protein
LCLGFDSDSSVRPIARATQPRSPQGQNSPQAVLINLSGWALVRPARPSSEGALLHFVCLQQLGDSDLNSVS